MGRCDSSKSFLAETLGKTAQRLCFSPSALARSAIVRIFGRRGFPLLDVSVFLVDAAQKRFVPQLFPLNPWKPTWTDQRYDRHDQG